MKSAATLVLAVLSVVLGACATGQAPVPVSGDAAGLGALAGDWGGDYQGTTRSGSIVFRLEAGADTAYGDVVMIPRERRESRLPVQDPSAGLPTPRMVEVLSIAFVRATGGGLEGRLNPYRDPDCDCVLDTRFQGRIRGDVIEGTFASTPSSTNSSAAVARRSRSSAMRSRNSSRSRPRRGAAGARRRTGPRPRNARTTQRAPWYRARQPPAGAAGRNVPLPASRGDEPRRPSAR